MPLLSWACLCNNSKWCLPHLLVPKYCTSWYFLHSLNWWAYFRETTNTLCNNYIQKRGVGIFSADHILASLQKSGEHLASFPGLVRNCLRMFSFPSLYGELGNFCKRCSIMLILVCQLNTWEQSLVMYLLHNAPERLLGCGLLRVGQIANDVWQNIVDGIPLQRKLNKQ